MTIRVVTVAQAYADMLNPLKGQKLRLNGALVNWDGKHLAFASQPHILIRPGQFQLKDITVGEEELTIPEWNQRLSN